MVAPVTLPRSLFPPVPREAPEVDSQGNFTELWSLFFGDLSQALLDNFKNEGVVFPPLTTQQADQITAIYAPYIGHPLPQNDPTVMTQTFVPDISGQTIYNVTLQWPQQFIIKYDASTPPNITSARWWTFTLT